MAEQPATPPPTPAKEDVYSLEQLLQYSQQIFGQPRFVLEGAIERAGLRGKLVTKTQLAAEIKAFLAQPDPRHKEA